MIANPLTILSLAYKPIKSFNLVTIVCFISSEAMIMMTSLIQWPDCAIADTALLLAQSYGGSSIFNSFLVLLFNLAKIIIF